MSEHTKGPWEVEKRDAASTGSVHYAVKTCYRPPEHPWSPRFITFMCGGLGDFHPSRPMADYRDDPQIDADAHLIAAAPTMLSALEAVRDLVAPESGIVLTTVSPSTKEARERIDRTFQLVADAIHAAKGQRDTAPDAPPTQN